MILADPISLCDCELRCGAAHRRRYGLRVRGYLSLSLPIPNPAIGLLRASDIPIPMKVLNPSRVARDRSRDYRHSLVYVRVLEMEVANSGLRASKLHQECGRETKQKDSLDEAGVETEREEENR